MSLITEYAHYRTKSRTFWLPNPAIQICRSRGDETQIKSPVSDFQSETPHVVSYAAYFLFQLNVVLEHLTMLLHQNKVIL
jgi:hypothetical protein